MKESVNKIVTEAHGTIDSDTKDALNNLYIAQYYGDEKDLKYGNMYSHKPYERLRDFIECILRGKIIIELCLVVSRKPVVEKYL